MYTMLFWDGQPITPPFRGPPVTLKRACRP